MTENDVLHLLGGLVIGVLAVVSAIIAIVRAVSAPMVRQEAKITALAEEHAKLGKELADYKLEVARTYASQGYLQDVERRIMESIDGLKDELRRLREAITDVKIKVGSS